MASPPQWMAHWAHPNLLLACHSGLEGRHFCGEPSTAQLARQLLWRSPRSLSAARWTVGTVTLALFASIPVPAAASDSEPHIDLGADANASVMRSWGNAQPGDAAVDPNEAARRE